MTGQKPQGKRNNQMIGKKEALVIIPTYNEVNNVRNTLEAVKSANIEVTVLFIDDNSADGTGAVLDDMAKRDSTVQVMHRPRRMGLGTAYTAGFAYALKQGFKFIVEMDADGQHDPRYLKDLIRLCDQYDLVIGSRYKGGIRFLNITLFRILLATLANRYIRFITGMGISDATSGLRVFRREVLEALPLEKIYSRGFAFQIEMAYRAWKKGFKIHEYPIIFYSRRDDISKMSLGICLEAFLVALRLRLFVR